LGEAAGDPVENEEEENAEDGEDEGEMGDGNKSQFGIAGGTIIDNGALALLLVDSS
jgi:hypothetical protein